VAEIEDWKEGFFLEPRMPCELGRKDDEALRENKEAEQKIGNLVMDIDILKEAAKRHPPTRAHPSSKVGVPRLCSQADLPGSRASSRWLVETRTVCPLRGRTKEAERAIEEACIKRFGTLRPSGTAPVIRSDNGLIFRSQRFRSACRDYRLRHEFITQYMPEQNGIIEWFFRSLKEECIWQHRFKNFVQAKQAIAQWIE
jgi:transposase InsO family protein